MSEDSLKTYVVEVAVRAENEDNARLIATPESGLDLSYAGIENYEVIGINEIYQIEQLNAPTMRDDGSLLPKYRLALTMLIDTHGVDVSDAAHRARFALRVPGGPFPRSVDQVHGPSPRWMCYADVVHAEMLSWRELEQKENNV